MQAALANIFLTEESADKRLIVRTGCYTAGGIPPVPLSSHHCPSVTPTLKARQRLGSDMW